MALYHLESVDYKLRQINTRCFICSELVKSRRRITWGYGNPNSKIMFIGEAPGRFGCDITGIPFTLDASGMLFQEALDSIGWSMEDIYTTNIVKCCPLNNRTPSEEEITHCSMYVEHEIDVIKPIMVVLLGGVAMKYFFPKAKSVTGNWNRELSHPMHEGITFIVLPHPAYIVRNKREKDGYFRDFLVIKTKLSEMIEEKR